METDLMGFAQLSSSIGGQHLSFSENTGFSSVAIDSRSVNEGALFFALEGSVSDGHGFVVAAFDAGARAAVVSSCKLESFNLVSIAQKMKKDLIVVQNTLKSLQDSARVYLEKFPNFIKIGITGSSGKTTTKEIAAAIISVEKNTIKNKGNLNSETGLPLSVFEIRPFHEVGVFELGMNRKGEIAEIADVLKPNIALVTNIGSAHIEYFGSKEEILKEKKCIYKFLKEDDIALIPKNDEYAKQLADGVTGKIKFFAEELFSELESTSSLGLEGSEIVWAGKKVCFTLPGNHCLEDAMAAIAIAKEIPVSSDAIRQGLASVKPLFGRVEIIKGRTTVIRDCYNANPESTAKSIEFCDDLQWQGRRVYVIADMLELGEESFSAHEILGRILSKSKADRVFLFGKEIKTTADYMMQNGKFFYYTQDMEQLSAALDSYVQTGDLVLLKGSRGCALERLTEILSGDVI